MSEDISILDTIYSFYLIANNNNWIKPVLCDDNKFDILDIGYKKKGWTLFQSLINYMRKRQDEAGYSEINTPDIMDKSLWELSGHLEKFGDNMLYFII